MCPPSHSPFFRERQSPDWRPLPPPYAPRNAPIPCALSRLRHTSRHHRGVPVLAASKDLSVRSVPLWQSILYPLPASEAGRVRRPRPWVAKTAATMVNITRLAAASVQSRPCLPNLLKLWPSSHIIDAMGMLSAESRKLNP